MSMKKKLFSVVLAAVMLLSLLPLTAVAANSAVSYMSPVMNNGVLVGFEEKSCSNYTDVSDIAPYRLWDTTTGNKDITAQAYNWGISDQDTWYVVSGNINLLGIVTVTGNVHLILKDGCNLTATGANYYAGICVNLGSSLTIYGQKNGTGEMIATGGSGGSGIGSKWGNSYGDIVINGGTVTATGNSGGAGIGGGEYYIYGTSKEEHLYNGKIVINGGTVTATGNIGGAGIGGGSVSGGAADGTYIQDCNIEINGGTVTAIGDGAGIGAGNYGSGQNITINGGNVTARSNGSLFGGAGIGGGVFGNCNNITINGGTIVAAGKNGGAGIGGGFYGTAQNIFIWGGNVTAISENRNTAIGAGYGYGNETPASNIEIDTSMTIRNEKTSAIVPNEAKDLSTVLKGIWKLSVKQGESVNYQSPIITETRLTGFENILCESYLNFRKDGSVSSKRDQRNNSALWGIDGQDTWYVASGDITISGGVTVYGNVHLILTDGCTLTVTGGGGSAGINVPINNTLTIYGQNVGNGTLIATGGANGAGIGGSIGNGHGKVTVNGGCVTATGGFGAAGIGGSYSDGGNLDVNGGTVIATGIGGGAGIGGGCFGEGHNVVIQGGNVTAIGDGGGAGIGGGAGKEDGSSINYGRNIVIHGGTVIATGNIGGAGIGGGVNGGDGYEIDICGGEVTANGGDDGAGIGGGSYGQGYSLNISGGTVVATGNIGGAAIGGGLDGTGSNIMIQGGNITANGGYASKTAIGNGQNADYDASNIKVNTALQILSTYENDEVKSTVIANDGEDLSSVLAGVMNLSITPKQESTLVTQAVKLRFHGVEGVVNEVELASGAALEETHLALPDPAFVGWYYDVNYETQAQVGDIISEDTELYLRETEDQTEYPYAEASAQTASLFADISTSALIIVAVILLGAGAAVVIVKKKKSKL